MENEKKVAATIQFLTESTAELRGRQSVRTTFKLSERAIEALSVLAGQLGIKQKSLFDHIVNDVPSLQSIARKFEEFGGEGHRIAKTYVISRRTLENLERISSSYETPRDALVEFSIERIIPLIEQEKKKYTRRKKLHAQMKILLEEGENIISEYVDEFDEDDPVFMRYLTALSVLNKSCDEADKYLERGRKVETF